MLDYKHLAEIGLTGKDINRLDLLDDALRFRRKCVVGIGFLVGLFAGLCVRMVIGG